MYLLKRSGFVLGALLISVLTFGQGVTTSSLNGRVVDTNGDPMPGATVVARHIPSGTQYGTATSPDGRFLIPAMRIGGPYTITITFVGYQEESFDDVFLSLGTAGNIDAVLSETAQQVGDVVVVGFRSSVFSSDRTGAATSIKRDAMTQLPTISRSINDFTRLTPQASGRSFVGADARFNNITIDGSIFNNSFGLADQPGGRTGSSPVSLDAIEEIQVSIAPYDVRQAGFIGAGVNAVTRSGTNDFTGSIFYNLRNERFLGTNAYGKEVTSDNFSIGTYGASIGGPIIKDKLFFFVNGEFERESAPGTNFIANDGATPVGGNVTRVLRTDLDNLRSYLLNNFGYETGPYEGYNNEVWSNKVLAKLDYNINDNHKLSIRYNWLDSERDVLASNSSSLGYGNRRSNTTALNYQNTNYIQKESIQSVIGELNSTIGRFSNNFIVGYTYQNEDRGSRGDFFPLVEIQDANSTYISFGFEPFTPNNKLNYKTFQLQNNLTYFAGKHILTAGFNVERFSFENVFFPGSQSVYVYNTLAEFYTDANDHLANPARTAGAGVNVKRFQLRYSALPGGAEPVQPTKVTYWGAYIQDQFTPMPGLKITAGLRIDVPVFEDTGFFNETVSTQTFKDRDRNDISINTAKLPDANPLFSPRLGFNYDVTGDRAIQFRGGSGLFTGRPAFVWISNQIGNNGVITGFDQIAGTSRYFNPDPTYWIPANPTLPSSYELAITDPSFKFPQVWRSNIAVDAKLPMGLAGTVEYVYNKEVNGIGYYNANLPVLPNPAATGPDRRPIFTSTRINTNVVNAIMLDNTNSGFGHSLAFSLEKQYSNGFFAKAAYSFGISKNTVDPGSIAAGSYNNNAISWDPNNAPLAFSNNDQRDRAIIAITYRKEYAKLFATQIGFFMEGRNQGRHSFIYSSDRNGDGNRNDLLYINTDPSEVIFQVYTPTGAAAPYAAADQAADWEAFVKQDRYLSSNRGEYSERNGAILPWIWNADLNITQEFFVNVGGKRNTIQVMANFLNFGNLLNNKWGVGYVINSDRPLDYRGVDGATGKPIYRMNNLGVSSGQINKLTETYSRRASIGDVWSAQLGLRYIFN